MNEPFNWGILGLGKIARKFAEDLRLIPGARLHAVASRSKKRAKAFAKEFEASFYYGSYEELVRTPELHAVYIATEHPYHCENTLLCLEHKLPVLCEKPFAMNRYEVRRMVETARREQTLLMEALWTRFLPSFRKTLKLIKKGAIGEVISVKADFGFKAPVDPERRLYNHALGGGALLDIGIYPVFLALLVLGKPRQMKALARIGPTGVDEEIGITFRYGSGKMAHLHASFLATTRCEAYIYGTEGSITIHPRWHHSEAVTLERYDHPEPKEYSLPLEGIGYRYEAEHFMECLERDWIDSPLMPHSFSLQLMEVLDAIREEAGVRYLQDEVG